MRLFASLEPSPEALAHLRRAVEAVRGPAEIRSGLRWTDPEQWHVTLAFYGEVPDGAWPGLAEALAERIAPLHAPRILLRGAGSFAGRNLWVGVAGESAADARALAEIVDGAAAAGVDIGLSPDPRPRNRAHLTLARLSSRGGPGGSRRGERGAGDTRRADRRRPDTGPDLDACVRALSVYAGPAWRADSVLLVRSSLGEGRSGGPLHEVIASLTPRG